VTLRGVGRKCQPMLAQGAGAPLLHQDFSKAIHFHSLQRVCFERR
jgi:hypothetical protein